MLMHMKDFLLPNPFHPIYFNYNYLYLDIRENIQITHFDRQKTK